MTEQAQTLQIAIERIYLKDASFESPKAPAVFNQNWQPQVQLDINTRSNDLGQDRFEVVLTVTLDAKVDETTGGETTKVSALIVELQQAGIFKVVGAEGQTREQVLAVACPNVLFPYIRETIDSLVLKGTFPPFMLAPVNFDALFQEAVRRRNETPDEVQN